MNLISFKYFMLVAITLSVYYMLPCRYRWISLLTGSIYFYLSYGKKAALIVFAISLAAYFAAIFIEGGGEKKKANLIMAVSVITLLAVLLYIKIGAYLKFDSYFFIVPVGISYFTLSIIGYLLDVYWKKDRAERNFLHFLTFVLYFPKVLQGPISNHKYIGRQLTVGHAFHYERVCFGLQLVIWGVFKKIVLADRMDILVSYVYGNLDTYERSGIVLIIAMLMSALQLYCDFSGYTDMAIGISDMFGIEIERNFNHPFFSKSALEFWQRWHMTLGGWFKDYLFLPVTRSKPVKKISKKWRERFGAIAGKKMMMLIATSVVWIATGVWHGTGISYLVWGIYWGLIIIFSQVFAEKIVKISVFLHINTGAPTWKLFQMIRTGVIFTVGRMIASQNSLYDVKRILFGIIKNLHLRSLPEIYSVGLAKLDFAVIIVGLVLLLAVSFAQERGLKIREFIAGWNTVPRWILYSISVTVILLIGVYGYGYDASTFAYQFF